MRRFRAAGLRPFRDKNRRYGADGNDVSVDLDKVHNGSFEWIEAALWKQSLSQQPDIVHKVVLGLFWSKVGRIGGKGVQPGSIVFKDEVKTSKAIEGSVVVANAARNIVQPFQKLSF